MLRPLLIAAGIDPIMALNIVGWTCWVPNLVVVEWWMRRGQSLAPRLAARQTA